MIYDCFTFYNELDVLEIRLNVLDDIVDKFVLVEATKTHSNMNKPLYFEQNKERFSRFLNKIVHLVVDSFPEYHNSWTYENYQRNYMIAGLSDCRDDDTIILSDCDEIPRPETILKVKDNPGVTCLLQDMYFYFLNYLDTKHYIWRGGTKVFKYKAIKNNLLDENHVFYNDQTFPQYLNKDTTLTKVRLYDNCRYVENGGWHFSYLGGVEAIVLKLKAFAHQEYNTDEMTDKSRLNALISSGQDIFGRSDHKFISIPIDNSYPRFINENIKKYDYLFYNKDLKHVGKFDKSVQLYSIILKNHLKRWGGKPMRLLVDQIKRTKIRGS